MKKKAKRYQSGGKTEEDYKREGLASSKGDKVGFFERLRMGNIDSPGSEAYYKFGAGRAKMAEEARTPVPEMSSDYSGRGASSPERAAESSMTSDYMPSRKAVDIGFGGAEEEESRKISDYIRTSPKEDSVSETIKEEVKAKPKPKPKPRKRVSQSFGETDSDALNRRRLEGLKKEDSPYGKSERLKALMGTFSSERSSKRYGESTPYARSKMGMKSGGKVSSASSRADGIAQRGKTKGRMV